MNPPLVGQGRCACTLPFSLHLTVMILGIVGFILGIVAIILNFVAGNVWLLVSTVLVFASGLQGLLVAPGSACFTCHIILAVINLVNLGVFGVACIFLASPFWIIWVVAVFVMELWVTIARFCCTTATGTAAAAAPATELPIAQPGAVHYEDAYKQPYAY